MFVYCFENVIKLAMMMTERKAAVYDEIHDGNDDDDDI